MNRLRKPAPAPISRRVFAAFGLAILIGAAVFAIWWTTAPRRVEAPGVASAPAGTQKPEPSASTAPPTAPPAAPPKVEESLALPRGGSVAGLAADIAGAVRWLTQAPLVRINRSTDAVEPWLAESWTASPDNLTYTLKLRPGLTWSDGTPLAIADVVAAFEPPDAAPSRNSTLPPPPTGVPPFRVAARDPSTLELRFSRPFAPALRLLDSYPILPRHGPHQRIGLGPFVMSTTPRSLAFARNPHYWRAADGAGPPYLDELTLPVRIDNVSAAGPFDFVDYEILPEEYEQVRKLEQDGKLRLFHLGPGLDADALIFALPPVTPSPPDSAKPDNVKPWFYTEAFRRAISTAIDRSQYCKQVFFSACDPVAGPVSPANAAWFDPDLPLAAGNAQVARTMLADLGLRDRSGDGILDDAMRRTVRFSMLIRLGVPSAARAATFLTNTLRAVGVEVEVTALSDSALRSRLTRKNYETVYDRVEVRDTDPAMNLGFWMTPEPAAGWQRQINELMIRNASSFDRVTRLQAFVEAQRIYSKYLPAIFLGVPHVRVYTSTRVLNARPSPLRPHVLWNADSLAVVK